MTELVNLFESLNQEQAPIALFAGILILCTGIMGTAAMARILSRRVLATLVLAAAAVMIVYRVAQ